MAKTKLTGGEIRKMPKNEKKVITFFLTIDEALDFQYMLKIKKIACQDYLRELVLREVAKSNGKM